MSTPVTTIADALFAFIMSLLRDPDAAAEFDAAPQATLSYRGLDDACAADVRAVKPVIVDHPAVVARTVVHQYPPTSQHDVDTPNEVIREITRIVNQFTSVDARTTIVDQSTNQNIWTNGGDVTQIFDQSAVVASGDDAIAAGDDATRVDSDVDITVGDVSVGNTTNDGSYNTDNSDNSTIDGSFNNTSPDNSTIDGSFNDNSTTGAAADEAADADVSDAAALAGASVTTAVDAATDAATSAVSQPADLLSADLTQSDVSYETDAASVLEEPIVDDLVEEQ